jgi:hypothetical protein
MNAVIIAQAQAAMATVNFIKTIGFDENNQSINVQFSYSAINATTGQLTENTLSVPLLSIVPIPYIRVRILRRLLSGVDGCTVSEAVTCVMVGLYRSAR